MAEKQRHDYRWYPLITAVFVTTLITSNIIAVRLVNIAGLILPAAVIMFPLAYIVADVLTEVYGYAKARQVIWTGFFCNLLAVAAIWLAGIIPAAPFWAPFPYQSPEEANQAYQAILGMAPRILLASFMAYLVGEFLNAIVLARMKLVTRGRFLWTRTIGSTLIGQGADSFVFITVAFSGIFAREDLALAIVSQWGVKVAYEVIATPLTYLVVNYLKRAERVDYFDKDTDFNPLKMS
jgi:queuosine precursor transporter